MSQFWGIEAVMENGNDDRSRWLAERVLVHEVGIRAWLRRFGNVSDADVDDLIQETYAILATRASVANIIDPRAYAYQVARSALFQKLRRAKVVSIDYVADIGEFDVPEDAPSPEAAAISRSELTRVVRAIEAMPQQTRRAFWLRRVEGMPQREIAAQLQLSENTVEKHIARGIRQLMDQFGRGGKAVREASSTQTCEPDAGTTTLDDPSRVRSKH